MTAKRLVLLVITHAVAGGIGFAAGVYFLPILIAPRAPTADDAKAAATGAQYTARVALAGRLAPGPDYKLYFSPEFVDTKEGFLKVKARSARVAEIKTFENFIVPLPASFDPAAFNTVVVWCETFSMFISAAQYR